MVKLKLGIFRSCRADLDPSTVYISPTCQRQKVITSDLRGTTLPPPSKQTPCGAFTKSPEIAFERGKNCRITQCRCTNEPPVSRLHEGPDSDTTDERPLSRPYEGQDSEVSPLWRSPARLSEMMWKVEGKVKESYPEVKMSQNPYEDFKKSMIEMIVEKQLYSQRDLNQLLLSFLSLNSRYHHGTIKEAFLDIWRTMVFDH